MEKEIVELFNQHIVEEAAHRFNIVTDELLHIGTFQNFVYEYRKNNDSYILRFTPSSHRNVNLVKGEIDWVLFLANHGVFVSVPIPSARGEYAEVIYNKDSYFTVTSFIKASGTKVGYPECLNDDELYEKLGQITGKIHALSKNYKAKDETIRRHDWSQNYYLLNFKNIVPSSQHLIYEGLDNLIDKIKSLPKDINSYGLIHGDINVNNFLVSDKTITLYDFDEAQYSWFVEDIAIQLYYLVYVYGGEAGKQDRENQANRFMKYFMKGYNQENSIADNWLKQIPLFLRLREIIVYTGAYRSWDFSKLNQWSKDWISESQTRIENGIPVVDIWN